jgi:ERCC4-type nuclease
LANRLLVQFGSIQAIVAANEEALIKVPGVGRKKAARIRELVR